MTVGARVKLARERRGLSNKELADRSGVSSGYISQLENEDPSGAQIKMPGVGKARALATALSVPLDWLATGEGPEPDWEPTSTSFDPPTNPELEPISDIDHRPPSDPEAAE